jgi:cell division septal protein FtsQ
LSAGGVGAHSNLLSLPVGRLEQRIRRLGWVRRVRVSRRPPHTVRIEIQERTPRCLVLVEGRLYYLDSDLKSFASTLGEAPPDLPVITGLKTADLANPDDEMKDLLAGAGRLLDQLPRTDLGPGGPVSEIHIDRVWGLSLVRDDLPALVRLGFKNFGPRLAALQRVAADLRRRGELERAILIDLESSRRVVVRLDKAA